MSPWNKIVNEPYRIFFPLGWIMGLIGTTYWLLVSAHLLNSFSPFFHGIIQIELFGSTFAIGFLLTALPKFLRTKSPTDGEVVCFLAVFAALAVTAIGNSPIAAQWLFILDLVLLFRFAVSRAAVRKSMPPYSFFLVGFGLLSGFLGAMLIVFPQQHFPLLGQRFLEQGMLLMMSLGVGSFLGPRLMGVVDIHNAVVSLPERKPKDLPWHKDPQNVVFLIGIAIFSSFPIEAAINRDMGFYLRAFASACCLWHFGILKIPRSESVIGPIVALALWMIVTGEILASLIPAHEAGMLHLTYVGGFGLLLLSIGAQVVSSHGGVARFWHTHRLGAACVCALVISASLIRMSATLIPDYYLRLLGISSLIFDIALFLWGTAVLTHVLDKTEV